MTEKQPRNDPAHSDEGSESDEPVSFGSFLLRRIIGPAAAIVILYASIRALPSLIVNQAPPIDGDDLLLAFVISLVGFAVLALWLDRRAAKKGKEE